MNLGLKNKNALITGGSQGIGFAIAKALAEEGCNVAIGARGRERLDQAAVDLSKLGVKAVPISVDFMTEEGCRTFVDNAVAALGGCDILVNNVGGMVPGTLESLTQEQWKEAIDRNLISYIHTTKFAIPHLKKAKAGRVLNISGISGTMLFPGALSTTLPNAAIIGFGKLMANDLAPFNVLVNNLCPGTIDVESWGPRVERMAKARGKTIDQVRDALAGMTMLNRLGKPEEMGWIAAFLVSEKNSYMTGTTVESCGGATKYI
jgi:3-oxoacyl-[acyl-carrier protein] reductase